MRSYRCLFLWLVVLLWYASMPLSARAQSPPDSVDGYRQRVGVRFGFSLVRGESPFFAGFTPLTFQAFANQISTGLEYGQSYNYYGWGIHCKLTRQTLKDEGVANTLGMYNQAIDRSAKIALQADKRTLDGLMLGIDGKVYMSKLEEGIGVIYLRAYTGLHYLTYNDFTITVNNRSAPRTDTTAHVSGASTLHWYAGFDPGFEFRKGSFGLCVEMFGFQFYANNAPVINFCKVGGYVFF